MKKIALATLAGALAGASSLAAAQDAYVIGVSAAMTGPASAPRPTSSTPATRRDPADHKRCSYATDGLRAFTAHARNRCYGQEGAPHRDALCIRDNRMRLP